MNPPSPIEASSLQPALAPTAKRLLPWLIAVAFFMESLDTTILNTAVPTIAAAIHVAPLSMKSVLASYTLSLAVFIPISGWMADHFGTRRVFASAIGIFTLGSFLCGISSDIHVLVACRILQGCGGSMMVPVGRLTIVRSFAKSELIRAMSFVAIPGIDWSHAGTDRRRPDCRILSLETYLLREYSDRPRRFVDGLPAHARLP
jgi:MFS family permease